MDKEQCQANLCQNIKTLRIQHNLTQAQMAHTLGISITSLRKIENGTIPQRLSYHILYALHFSFGIDIDDLFTTVMKVNSEQ